MCNDENSQDPFGPIERARIAMDRSRHLMRVNRNLREETRILRDHFAAVIEGNGQKGASLATQATPNPLGVLYRAKLAVSDAE